MKVMIVILLFCAVSTAFAFRIERPAEDEAPQPSETSTSAQTNNGSQRIKRGDPCTSENIVKHTKLGIDRGGEMGREAGSKIGEKTIPVIGKQVGGVIGGLYGAIFWGAAGAIYQTKTCKKT